MPPDFKPRRSSRIALDKRTGSSALRKAQGNLMKKMGIVEEEGTVSDEDLQHYIDVFNSPLSTDEVAALARLLHVEVDGEALES
jgi:hypothetical protein